MALSKKVIYLALSFILVIYIMPFLCWIFGSMILISVSETEIYLIADGYIGPVLLVFDQPNGTPSRIGRDGSIIYEIPPNGVLFTQTEEQPHSQPRFYYVQENDDLVEIETPISCSRTRNRMEDDIEACRMPTVTSISKTKTPHYKGFIVSKFSEQDSYIDMYNQLQIQLLETYK